MKYRKQYNPLVIASGCIKCADILIAEMLHQKRIFNPHLHITWGTYFGPAFVFEITDEQSRSVRVLCVDGAYQSATFLHEHRNELVFEYYRSFDIAFEILDAPHSMLVIGGGGCSYPRYVLEHHPTISVTVCEVDPAIMNLARQYFYVDDAIEAHGWQNDNRFFLINKDGLSHLNHTSTTYDIIINDAFTGDASESSLLTTHALCCIDQHLTNNGLYLLNIIDNNTADGTYQNAVSSLDSLKYYLRQLSSTFNHVVAIPSVDEEFSGRNNYLLIASQQHKLSSMIPHALSLDCL